VADFYEYTVGITVDPAQVAELNRWYDEEHIADMLSIPGVRAARRYESVADPASFLAVYEVSDPEVVTGEAYRDRPTTEWTRRMAAQWRQVDRRLWRPLP